MMKFEVKTAEAIYTGGGIYVFAGITTYGLHFIASDDPEWVMLTDKPTMEAEITDSEQYDDLWQPDWQEANCIYDTTTEEEARQWLLKIYDWLIEHTCTDDTIKMYRNHIREELGILDTREFVVYGHHTRFVRIRVEATSEEEAQDIAYETPLCNWTLDGFDEEIVIDSVESYVEES